MLTTLVVGLGEIGQPLLDILSETYSAIGRDVDPIELDDQVDVMHVCYPYEVGDFVQVTGDYIAEYRPSLTIIHSTVVPGTTAQIHRQTGTPIAYSPVRGKHTRMREQLRSYTKHVAGVDPAATNKAASHLEEAGLPVESQNSPEALELAKLVETTYFGVLLAWSQEVERYCRELDVEYDEVMALSAEVPYLPPVIFQPGYIGGHCVIPNTYLLEQVKSSDFLDLIRASNETKRQEWEAEGRSLEKRLSPKDPSAERKESSS